MVLKIIFLHFFYVHEDRSEKLNNKQILSTKNYLKNKSIGDIIFSQKKLQRMFLIEKIYLLEALR